jgi:hypothetical protein
MIKQSTLYILDYKQGTYFALKEQNWPFIMPQMTLKIETIRKFWINIKK